jgi:hypothetical protein
MGRSHHTAVNPACDALRVLAAIAAAAAAAAAAQHVSSAVLTVAVLLH